MFIAFTMMCAGGPFTSSDNLLYEPLHDLLSAVREEQPDVLVLVSGVSAGSDFLPGSEAVGRW